MNPRFSLLSARGRKLIALPLAVLFAACTNIHDDRTRTQTEGAVAGAAAGAAIGAGAGALLSKNKGQGALIGGAAGALAGGLAGQAYGTEVAKKKEGYASEEDTLDTRLRTARREISERQTFNEGLKLEVARHRERLEQLRAEGRATGLAVEQFELRSTLAKRIGELDHEARSWQASIDAHKAALQQQRGDPRASTLRSDIATLSKQSDELARQRSELLSISQQAQ